MAGYLLDGLLLLVVALYVPIGTWRGGLREGLLGGTILLSALLGERVGASWGDALATPVDVSESTAAVIVVLLLLAVVGLGLGYGAGSCVGSPRISLEGKMSGGIVGGLNVLILLSFALDLIQEFAPGTTADRTINASIFADNLADSQSWLLAVICCAVAGLILIARFTTRFDRDLIETMPDFTMTDAARRRLAVAPPVDPDSGKVDPGLELSGASEVDASNHRSLRRSTQPVVVTASSSLLTLDSRAVPAGTWGDHPNGESGPAIQESSASSDSAVDSYSPLLLTHAALRHLIDLSDPGPGQSTNASGNYPPVGATLSTGEVTGEATAAEAASDQMVRYCGSCGTPTVVGLSICPRCGNEV